jgi:hypothetical protein
MTQIRVKWKWGREKSESAQKGKRRTAIYDERQNEREIEKREERKEERSEVGVGRKESEETR